MVPLTAVCLLVIDGPNICYWFILIGCICSCLPTFAIIHRRVKEREMARTRRFETVSSWLKSKNYVEMDNYQEDGEHPVWTTTTQAAKNESI